MQKLLFFVIFFPLAAFRLFAADSRFEPLWLYQGTFEVTMNAPGSKAVSNRIQNDCADLGQFFICQQTVDGKVAALLTFTPAETKGHYYTNPVFPDGRAAGRGELEIEGDRWTYPSKEEQNGKTEVLQNHESFFRKGSHSLRAIGVGGWQDLDAARIRRRSAHLARWNASRSPRQLTHAVAHAPGVHTSVNRHARVTMLKNSLTGESAPPSRT